MHETGGWISLPPYLPSVIPGGRVTGLPQPHSLPTHLPSMPPTTPTLPLHYPHHFTTPAFPSATFCRLPYLFPLSPPPPLPSIPRCLHLFAASFVLFALSSSGQMETVVSLCLCTYLPSACTHTFPCVYVVVVVYHGMHFAHACHMPPGKEIW